MASPRKSKYVKGLRGKVGGARPGAGRPSKYSVALADRICKELMMGKSLIKICEADDMPDRVTVVRWMDDPDKADFASKYARARVAQADFMDDRILEVADNSTSESSPADRVKIDAYKWRASKLKPKVYGDKVTKEVTGADGGPVKFDISGLSDAELEAFANLLARTGTASTADDQTGASETPPAKPQGGNSG